MSQPNRLPEGGRIDRSRPLSFTFNGTALSGFAGDTVCSALLANGVRTVARSFKYHRRRVFLPPVWRNQTLFLPLAMALIARRMFWAR